MVTPFERALMKVGELVLVADIQSEQLAELGQKLDDSETTVAELEAELEDLTADAKDTDNPGIDEEPEDVLIGLTGQPEEVDEEVDAPSDAA